MNTFLKVLLVAVAILVAIKLLPITLLAACLLGGAVLAVLIVGVSAAAGVICIAAVLAAALSPIWLPIVAIVGVIALVKRSRRSHA